jgi:hypothetical protein
LFVEIMNCYANFALFMPAGGNNREFPNLFSEFPCPKIDVAVLIVLCAVTQHAVRAFGVFLLSLSLHTSHNAGYLEIRRYEGEIVRV